MPSLFLRSSFLSRSVTFVNNLRLYSAESLSLTQQFQKATNPNFKTTKYACLTKVADPREHSQDQESLFYQIPKEDVATFLEKSLPYDYHRLASAFNENGLMIRQPALKGETFYDVKVI